MQIMKEVSEKFEKNYLKNLDYRYVAQPVNDLLFPWEPICVLLFFSKLVST